jgi:hypothetical protein
LSYYVGAIVAGATYWTRQPFVTKITVGGLVKKLKLG